MAEHGAGADAHQQTPDPDPRAIPAEDDTAELDRFPTDRLVRVIGRASPPAAVAVIIAVVLTRGWPPEQVTAVLTLLVPVLILLLVFGFVGYPSRRP